MYDILIARNDMTSVETAFKFFLHNHFKLKDLSPLKYFVVLEIERSTKDMHFLLPTHIYGLEILLDTGFFFFGLQAYQVS